MILNKFDVKNIMHYAESTTANATRTIAALASLRDQISHLLQSLYFIPRNPSTYYYTLKRFLPGSDD